MTEAGKVGLIAGAGRFPFIFAEQAQRQGVEVVALGINGVTDPSLEKVAKIQFYKLGQIDKPIQYLKNEGISRVVMAGKVQLASLYGGVMPDLRAIKLLARLKDKRTDTILGAVAAEFAKDGIELISSSTYLSHLIPAKGTVTRRVPSAAESADMELGWRAAKALAGIDVGQTVVVKEGAVIALEAMEGTDACIRRAAEISRSFGQTPTLVVVKVAKPKQDVRFDLPVIGLDSLQVFEACKVSAVAIEAGKTLLFDKEKFIEGADRLGIAITAMEDAPGGSA